MPPVETAKTTEVIVKPAEAKEVQAAIETPSQVKASGPGAEIVPLPPLPENTSVEAASREEYYQVIHHLDRYTPGNVVRRGQLTTLNSGERGAIPRMLNEEEVGRLIKLQAIIPSDKIAYDAFQAIETT